MGKGVTDPIPKVDPQVAKKLADDAQPRPSYVVEEKDIAPGVSRRRTTAKLTNEDQPGQTYARVEDDLVPGVKRRTTTAARQSEATIHVREVSVKEINAHVDAMNKKGINFKFEIDRLAAHAEVKSSIARPNKPIYVSQQPCSSCQLYFSAEARYQGKTQYIVDPDRTWVFEPDGSIWTRQH
jgi:hypothetical protein